MSAAKAAYVVMAVLIVATLMYGSATALHKFARMEADISDLKAQVEQLQKDSAE